MGKRSGLPKVAQRNIDSIAQVEQQLLSRRPLLLRVGDTIAHFFGSVWFIGVQALLIVAWMLWNLPSSRVASLPVPLMLMHAIERRHTFFDPYPYPLLSLLISVEFLFLTTFVLMNQKHASRRNEHWAHLHLQLSMLTEQEVTKNLQLLDSICRHIGCHSPKGDRQLAELVKPTQVADMVKELEKSRLPVTDGVPTIEAVEAIERAGDRASNK